MAFASGGFHGLKYVTETSFGVMPSLPTMAELRHTSCSLVLGKDSLQSKELRHDRQISDMRHGVPNVSGSIGFEFSYGEFDTLFAAAISGAWDDDVLDAGTTVPYFSFERSFSDIGQYQLFTGCAINKLSLDLKTNAMVTGSFDIVGKAAAFATSTAASTTTHSQTHSPLDCFSGVIKEGGTQIAVITGISVSVDNAITPALVIGSKSAAAMVPGRLNVTGTVSAFFENTTLLSKFKDETESNLEITLGSGGPGSYIVSIPRIKYSGGNNSVDGEGSITLNMPFQALLDSTTGTNIRITRIPLI